MRILVISDIHANLTAFEAVLADAAGEWDRIWFLGDLVGYGPDPNECVALLQEHDHLALSGNHDWAVLGKLDIENFNFDARNAVLWAREVITPASVAYLDALPPQCQEGEFNLVHASPRHPVWEYIIDTSTAADNFEYFTGDYCLVGHTHVPVVFAYQQPGLAEMFQPVYNRVLHLRKTRYIVNPGSVGQPRDADPRAAYALLDVEKKTWVYKRVSYDVAATQARMRAAGLSERLAARLAYGW